MGERDNISHLETIYKAQTEAYLEVHAAIIDIVSKQNDIITKLDSHKDACNNDFQNLYREYYALEKILTNFQNNQITRDSSMEGSVDDFKASITNFNEDLITLHNEIKELKSVQNEMKNFWNRVTAITAGGLGLLTIIQLITGKGLLDFIK